MPDCRPNILLIFTDQQRADTIHAGGNSVIRTPNLDKLCREGVRFSSAYTPSPECVPARCSLIFGKYPHQAGCYSNAEPMPESADTFMAALSMAGYRTHGIGKMHFTPAATALRGFQSREVQEEIGMAGEHDDYRRYLQGAGLDHIYDLMGPRGEMYYIPQPAQMAAKHHATAWVGERSVEFIRQQRGGQPFFLWSSFIHPHPPFSPPTPWNKLYRAALMLQPHHVLDEEFLQTYINKVQNRYKYRDDGSDLNLLRMMKAYYYACISFIDFQIGRILGALEEVGQLDNTLILFSSDHGEYLGDYGCFGKRGMLNPPANIPLLARLPGRFEQDAVCDTPVSLVDIYPTILAAAGISPAADGLPGIDLAGLAGEHAAAYYGRTIYSQWNRSALGLYMALNRRFKYIYSAPDRREYLFDRRADPREERSRADVVFCRQDLRAMRESILGYFNAEGYTEPLESGGWKLFPQPVLPDDPDAGLLIQDPSWAEPYQVIPGYTNVEE
ncbi:MAG: sulfatase-like hydrolase/transferase [Chloroflexi bacterium]|nr:sulfatase-like hydrolase/transferase [Chloroflexota bacterium]